MSNAEAQADVKLGRLVTAEHFVYFKVRITNQITNHVGVFSNDMKCQITCWIPNGHPDQDTWQTRHDAALRHQALQNTIDNTPPDFTEFELQIVDWDVPFTQVLEDSADVPDQIIVPGAGFGGGGGGRPAEK